MSIGNRLKNLRNKNDLTQKNVASKLGLNNKTLSGYENDVSTPDADTLAVLAKFYGVSVNYLITGESDAVNHDDFMKTIEVQFMDASENDRDKIYRKVSELYWKYKDK